MIPRKSLTGFYNRSFLYRLASLGTILLLLLYWQALPFLMTQLPQFNLVKILIGLIWLLGAAWLGGESFSALRDSVQPDSMSAPGQEQHLLHLIQALQTTSSKGGEEKDLLKVLLTGVQEYSGAEFCFVSTLHSEEQVQGGWTANQGVIQCGVLPQKQFTTDLGHLLATPPHYIRHFSHLENQIGNWPEDWPRLPKWTAIPVKRGDQVSGVLLLGSEQALQPNALRDLPSVLSVFAHLVETCRREQHQRELETTLRNNSAELASYAERLKLSNQALEEYALIASHDLQEPLRKMQMLGSILHRKGETIMDDECKIYLSRLMFLSRKMQSMIGDVLTLSKITSKSQPFRKVTQEDLLPKVLRNLEPLIQDSQTQIEWSEISPLWGDPAQLRQLLEHLLENAIKFRKPDVPPHIRIQLVEGADGYGELIVEDNGIGFEERYSDRIFRIFERLHGENTYTGHGIGLAICKKIAEQHQGSIRAHSIPDQGSAFIVTLPLAGTKDRLQSQPAALFSTSA